MLTASCGLTLTLTRALHSLIGVPTSDDGSVDCNTYYIQLSGQTSLAPVEIQLRPIAMLFDPTNSGLWKRLLDTGVTVDQLSTFGQKFRDYVQKCTGGGCSSVSNNCNKGFYGTAPDCKSCYGGSGTLGSVGNCADSQTCDSSGNCQGQIPTSRNKITWDETSPDGILYKGSKLVSNNGICELRFQDPDGNIVMYRKVCAV